MSVPSVFPCSAPNQSRLIAVRRWANVVCSPSSLGSCWGKLLSALKRVSQPLPAPRSEGGTSFFNNARNVCINGGMTININTVLSGITLIDAGAKEHHVPMNLASSYEIFAKTLNLLLSGSTIEAKVQRRFMEAGMYDLCIDYGSLVAPIAAERDWSMVQPGTKVVMRIVVLQLDGDARYQCPRCKTWNLPHESIKNASTDCGGCYGRFQLSETDLEPRHEIGEGVREQNSQGDLKMLRNFHLKRRTTPPLESPKLPFPHIHPFHQNISDMSSNKPAVKTADTIHLPIMTQPFSTAELNLAPSDTAMLNENEAPPASPQFSDMDGSDYLTSPTTSWEYDFDYGISPERSPSPDLLCTPLFSDEEILVTPPMMMDAPLFSPHIESEFVEEQVLPGIQYASDRSYAISSFSPAIETFPKSSLLLGIFSS